MSKSNISPLNFSPETASDDKIKAGDLDFYNLLRRQSSDGQLFFNQQRAILFDVDALGNLRQLLVSTLGEDVAAGIFMKFGYTQGYHDAELLGQNFEWASDEDWLAAGPMLHMLKGIVQALPEQLEFDRAAGNFYMQGVWRNSYEAEDQLKRFGPSQHPVCWILAGYAAGYASRFTGQELLAVETACVGMGHSQCTWEIKPLAAWGSEANYYLQLMQTQREAETRLRETQILQQLTESLAGALRGQDVINVFFKSCTQLLHFDFAIFSLVDPAQRRVKAVAGVNVTDGHLSRANHPLDSRDIMADIIRTGKTEIIKGWDARFDAGNFDAEKMAQWGTRVFAPITLHNEHIGLVEVGFNRNIDETVQAYQIKLLHNLIGQTALALERARRYEASEQVAHREQVLRQVTAKIRGSADMNSVMRTAALEIGRVLGRQTFVYLGQEPNGQEKDA